MRQDRDAPHHLALHRAPADPPSPTLFSTFFGFLFGKPPDSARPSASHPRSPVASPSPAYTSARGPAAGVSLLGEVGRVAHDLLALGVSLQTPPSPTPNPTLSPITTAPPHQPAGNTQPSSAARAQRTPGQPFTTHDARRASPACRPPRPTPPRKLALPPRQNGGMSASSQQLPAAGAAALTFGVVHDAADGLVQHVRPAIHCRERAAPQRVAGHRAAGAGLTGCEARKRLRQLPEAVERIEVRGLAVPASQLDQQRAGRSIDG